MIFIELKRVLVLSLKKFLTKFKEKQQQTLLEVGTLRYGHDHDHHHEHDDHDHHNHDHDHHNLAHLLLTRDIGTHPSAAWSSPAAPTCSVCATTSSGTASWSTPRRGAAKFTRVTQFFWELQVSNSRVFGVKSWGQPGDFRALGQGRRGQRVRQVQGRGARGRSPSAAPPPQNYFRIEPR